MKNKTVLIKPLQLITFLFLFVLLFLIYQTKAQKKSTRNGLKATFRNEAHIFIWQPERDTLLPAAVFYKEEMEILPDSVIIKRYYTKKPMKFHTMYFTDYGNTDNKEYQREVTKAHYKVYFESLSVWNAGTKKYDMYKLSRDNFRRIDKLINLTTQKKYKRDGIHDAISAPK